MAGLVHSRACAEATDGGFRRLNLANLRFEEILS